MRFAPLAALFLLACTAAVYAQNKTVEEVPTRQRTSDETNASLEKRLPELRFDNVGFSEVIDFLRDVTGANVFVNWKKLEAAGVDRNAPVTARMRDVPFRKALRIILDNVTDKTKLDWVIDEGVITISTADDLQSNVVTRVYDVRQLEKWRKNAAPATRPTDAKDPLIGLITGSIAPASWDKTSKVSEVDGQLIVTATEENHKLIANLLENLKRLAK